MSTKDDDTVIWPVTDAQIDAEELEAMGTVLVNSSVSTYSGYTPTTYIDQQVNADGDPTVNIHGDLVIADTDGKNEINVSDFMKTMQERMLVLQANFEAMEEYPALKDAYDQYKMLEKLLMESDNDPEKKS